MNWSFSVLKVLSLLWSRQLHLITWGSKELWEDPNVHSSSSFSLVFKPCAWSLDECIFGQETRHFSGKMRRELRLVFPRKCRWTGAPAFDWSFLAAEVPENQLWKADGHGHVMNGLLLVLTKDSLWPLIWMTDTTNHTKTAFSFLLGASKLQTSL